MMSKKDRYAYCANESTYGYECGDPECPNCGGARCTVCRDTGTIQPAPRNVAAHVACPCDRSADYVPGVNDANSG